MNLKIPNILHQPKKAINLPLKNCTPLTFNDNSNKCDELFQNFRMTFCLIKSILSHNISKIVFIPKCLLMFLLLIFIRLIMLKRSRMVLSHSQIVYYINLKIKSDKKLMICLDQVNLTNVGQFVVPFGSLNY